MNFHEWYATHHQQHILVKDLEYCWNYAKRDFLADIAPFIKHSSDCQDCEACKIIKIHTDTGALGFGFKTLLRNVKVT